MWSRRSRGRILKSLKPFNVSLNASEVLSIYFELFERNSLFNPWKLPPNFLNPQGCKSVIFNKSQDQIMLWNSSWAFTEFSLQKPILRTFNFSKSREKPRGLPQSNQQCRGNISHFQTLITVSWLQSLSKVNRFPFEFHKKRMKNCSNFQSAFNTY